MHGSYNNLLCPAWKHFNQTSISLGAVHLLWKTGETQHAFNPSHILLRIVSCIIVTQLPKLDSAHVNLVVWPTKQLAISFQTIFDVF